jgi:hypothetical protein
VLIEEHHAQSDAWVVQQTAHLSLQMNWTHGLYSGKHVVAGIGDFGPYPTFFSIDDSGTLYMRDTVDRPFRLGEFFENWGYAVKGRRIVGFENLKMKVNGVPSDEGARLIVHDGDRIQLSFRGF